MKKLTFTQGDFVRSSVGPVGVVWRCHPKSGAAIEVYYWIGATSYTKGHEEKELSLVPAHQAPPYAIRLKAGLGFS